MRFKFTIETEVEREEGLFESRESIAAALMEAIEGADPGSVSGDNGSTYATQSWDVSEEEQVKPKGRRG